MELPRGFAVIFHQKGMLHAGLPVSSGVKYIAQAGVCRGQAEKVVGAPSLFKWGSGLAPY